MIEIPLTRGYVAIVDDDCPEDVLAMKWYARVARNGNVYAVRSTDSLVFATARRREDMYAKISSRFDHHPDPVIDYLVEIDAIEGLAADVAAGLACRQSLEDRIDKAMGFRVGGDQWAVAAKQVLRAIAAQWR